MIDFPRAYVYLTVATVLDRHLPDLAEKSLLRSCHKYKSSRKYTGWQAGRPEERWGLHADILFRTGLTGSALEQCAQEVFLKLEPTLENRLPSIILAPIIPEFISTEEAEREEPDKLLLDAAGTVCEKAQKAVNSIVHAIEEYHDIRFDKPFIPYLSGTLPEFPCE